MSVNREQESLFAHSAQPTHVPNVHHTLNDPGIVPTPKNEIDGSKGDSTGFACDMGPLKEIRSGLGDEIVKEFKTTKNESESRSKIYHILSTITEPCFPQLQTRTTSNSQDWCWAQRVRKVILNAPCIQ